MFSEAHQISVLRFQDFYKEIPSDLVRKDVADFSVSFPISSMELWKCLRQH